MLRPQEPRGRSPIRPPAGPGERQDVADDALEPLLEDAAASRARSSSSVELRVAADRRSPAAGARARGSTRRPRSRNRVRRVDAERPASARDEALASCCAVPVVAVARRRRAGSSSRSARRRVASSSRAPSAAATRRDTICPGRSAAGRPARSASLQPAQQLAGQPRFVGPERRDVPLVAVHVVDRHERRLAAHRQPHVAARQLRIDASAERVDRRPLFFGIRLGDARRSRGSRRHATSSCDEARPRTRSSGAGRSGAALARLGVAGQRDVTLAGEQPRGRIEPDPARAGQVHFGPGVQVGEVCRRSRRPVERLHVGLELDQVARHEPRRQARDGAATCTSSQPVSRHEPRAQRRASRRGVCTPGSMPDQVADLARAAGD